MTFKDYLQKKKPQAERALKAVLDSYRSIYADESWFEDVVSHLTNLIPKGKLTRFSLAQLGYEGYKQNSSDSTEILGICLEMIQTGLLFHDDIMDEDVKRRGIDSLHIQYSKSLKKAARNPKHLGESLAICVGDFTFFIIFDVIQKLKIKSKSKYQILSLFSQEFSRVTLAQMQDTYFGQTAVEPTWDEILHMYQGKTGRYSVALPLVCGSIMANAPSGDVSLLWTIGEKLGVLYQIRDDALSLFGDEKITGKPVGSDIIQNKKTLYRHYLMTHCDSEMKKKLDAIFGNSTISHDNMVYVHDCLERTGTISWVTSYSDGLAKEAKTDITKLGCNKTTKELFYDFLTFVTARSS